MRSVIRKGLTTTAGVALAGIALAMLPGSAQADDGLVSQASRVAKYQAYLAMKVAQGDEQAKETAQGFSALSSTQKTRFLDLLEDRSLMKQLFEDAESPAAAGITRSVLAGGDVVVERESAGGGDDASPNSSTALRAAGYRDMWASYSYTDKFMGVKVSRVSVRTNYQVKGKDTTKVYPGSASHYLFVPGCDFSHSPVKEWISSPPADNAQSETIWTASCWGSSWDERERVWGDYRGFVGGYLKDE
ncbi:hypothetical protein [Streptomyces sp. XY332]|uniref:hypothetical protein n=1 Tax=Streptomyces sp. XY332 TaxID=1415561 RepID=UPI000ACB7C27|nr:hypothetical protein [Streptomyces sp. XY332]